ncbi:MAG: hypothetical protein AAF502_08925 [Bacteroidota bacterium]
MVKFNLFNSIKTSFRDRAQQKLRYWSLGLVLLLFAPVLFGQNIQFQINVNVPQQIDPDIYRLQTDPNIFIDLFSDADQSYQAIFEVVAEEMDLGEVFRATSHPRNIPAGMWNETIDNTVILNEQEQNSAFTTFSQIDYNPDLSAQTGQFGLLPDGIYTICVYAYLFPDGQLLAQGCNNTMVILPEPPIPVSPTACEDVAAENVLFNWTPVLWDGPVVYRISIFNVLPGQEITDALLNVPHAVDEVVDQTNYIYSSANLPLEQGQYVWVVEALNENDQPFTDPIANEPECFNFNPPVGPGGNILVDIIEPLGECDGPAEGLPSFGENGIDVQIEYSGDLDGLALYVLDENAAGFDFSSTINSPLTDIPFPEAANFDVSYATNEPAVAAANVPITPVPPGTIGELTAVGFKNLQGQDIVVGISGTTCFVYPDSIFNVSNPPPDSLPVPFLIPEQQTYPCMPYYKIKAEPKLDGGIVMPFHQEFNMARSQFVPLKAFAKDYDLVEYGCEILDNCQDTPSKYEEALPGAFFMNWTIISGGGSFVHIGCLPENVTEADGENVIYKPPYVAPGKKVEVKVMVTIADPASGPAKDANVVKTATLTFERNEDGGDYLRVKMVGDAYSDVAEPDKKKIHEGTCKSFGLDILPGNGLVAPSVILPATPDNNKLAAFEWMSLTVAPMPDADGYKVTCYGENCESGSVPFNATDHVSYQWNIISGPGSFIHQGGVADNTAIGKRVTLQANGAGEIVIGVKAYNPLIVASDPQSDVTRFTIKAYTPGILFEKTPRAWLPKHDTVLQLKAKMKIRNGNTWTEPLAHMCHMLTFNLTEVSREPGTCTNHDNRLHPKNNTADLHFSEPWNHQKFELRKAARGEPKFYMEAESKNHFIGRDSMAPYLLCYDYGAYGKVEVSYTGRWQSVDGKEITVPLDENDNKIADGAPHDRASSNTDDSDNFPLGDFYRGDGFTAYEEYRGFVVTDNSTAGLDGRLSHIRTNINRKDLFLVDPRRMGSGYYNQSDITIHFITRRNMRNDRVVNFKSINFRGGDQHALLLTRGWIDNSTNGFAHSVTNQPSTPKDITHITINQRLINTSGADINAVIAHEIGHGTNVKHHGEGSLSWGCVVNPGTGGCVSMPWPEDRTKWAGALSCFMRYSQSGARTQAGATMTSCLSTRLCVSTGTHRNTGFFNDNAIKNRMCKIQGAAGNPYGVSATNRGKCYYQVRVKDW